MHPSKLHVISVITNPVRYRSRYNLYKDFEKHVLDAGALLYTVEAAFGERPHVVTKADDPRHFQFRTVDELWHKENLINLALSRLPADWKYVAWVDADVRFARPDWAAETVHQLQHYEVVQMWSAAQDLDPSFEPYKEMHRGFVWSMHHEQRMVDMNKYGGRWHPGFAWAATREAINHLGGLLDVAVLGAADKHMAYALYGLADQTLKERYHPNYAKAVLGWQARARYLHNDVGYVPGLLLHDFHGKKKHRFYVERRKVLVDNAFDPEADLTKDWQGMYQIRPERTGLRDAVRRYFRSRNEDSIDVD